MQLFNQFYKLFIQYIGMNCIFIFIIFSTVASASQGKDSFAKANLFIQKGQYLYAVQVLDNISKNFSKSSVNYLKSQIIKANAIKAMGQHKRALSILTPLLQNIKEYAPAELAVRYYIILGKIYVSFSNQEIASKCFEKGLKIAKQSANQLLVSEVLNEMGILFYIYAEKPGFAENSIQAFEHAINYSEEVLSVTPDIHFFHGQLLVNIARASLHPKNNFETAKKLDRINQALNFILDLPDTYKKGRQLLIIANFFEQVALLDKKKSAHYLEKAFKIYNTIDDLNQLINNDRLASMVYCRMGALYERSNMLDSSITLTRKAIFAAQKISDTEQIYVAHWQLGRLYNKMGQTFLAIDQYQKSIEALTPIRQQIYHSDLMKKNVFDRSIKPVYLELAEIFFDLASTQIKPEEYEKMIRQVWTTMDKVKSAELEDIFHDECVSYQKSNYLSLDDPLDFSAVMYLIPFQKQPGMIIKLPNGFKHFRLKVYTQTFNKEIYKFRHAISQFGEIEDYAIKLYEWIISPIYNDLKKQEVKTLVVASDGAIRLLPFSLFLKYDETFLIEEFEIVTIPSLKLTRTAQTNRDTPNILLCGLTKERIIGNKIYPALPFVNKELEKIRKIVSGDIFLNADFSLSNLSKFLSQNEISIIHMATHGEFVGIPEKTFLLTEKGRLTINDLEKLIKQTPSASIDLLTLSACQTALGDERAAFGLAGVAVKAGAKCAVASLWSVDDYTSQKIITEFYQNVYINKTSKAKALQLAQIKLLEKPQYWNPAYWAAFLVIGNWY
ncbi:conserved hypothetical protein, secreted [Candidatus Magnetomorum sp. HK-1]|nr:conserved hypothetical protein, secreted [Candidatus Magnetomorum sp. HK-1]